MKLYQQFASLLLIALAATVSVRAADTPPRQPKHILWIMADQYRYDAFNFAGDRHVPTPNLDKLASQGIYLKQTYCQFALCMPSRTSFTVGRYAHSTGIYSNYLRDSHREQVSFPQVLRQNGILTQVLGKLHVPGRDGLDWDNPEDQFEQKPKERRQQLEGKIGATSEPLTQFQDWIWKDETVDFLKKHAHERWFLECSFVIPHPPYITPKANWDRVNRPMVEETVRAIKERYPAQTRSKNDERAADSIQAYYGNVNAVDTMVGEILATLDQLGIREDTLVIFTADHGEMLYEHYDWGKQEFYDHSVRVPLIISWPGVLPQGKTSDALVQMIDLYPTILDVFNLPVPQSAQGKSLLPLMRGKIDKQWDVVYSELKDARVMQFDGRYKWIDNAAEPPEVYDMKNDPWEIKNLAALPEFRDRMKTKTEELRKWRATDLVAEITNGKPDKSARRKAEKSSDE